MARKVSFGGKPKAGKKPPATPKKRVRKPKSGGGGSGSGSGGGKGSYKPSNDPLPW